MSSGSSLELKIVGATLQLQELEDRVSYGSSLELRLVRATSQLQEVEG
jgi:hypothetical protein